MNTGFAGFPPTVFMESAFRRIFRSASGKCFAIRLAGQGAARAVALVPPRRPTAALDRRP